MSFDNKPPEKKSSRSSTWYRTKRDEKRSMVHERRQPSLSLSDSIFIIVKGGLPGRMLKLMFEDE